MWILEEGMFENKSKILMFILTGGTRAPGQNVFSSYRYSTIPVYLLPGIRMGEYLAIYGEKTFRSGADVPLPEKQST